MKTLALAITAAIGLAACGTESAEAGHGCGYGYSGGFGGYGGYSSFYRPSFQSYGHLHHNVNPNTATWGGGHLHWHDTSHYDYVPSRVIPHGNHYHYQPGGYIYHQDGHYDLHH